MIEDDDPLYWEDEPVEAAPPPVITTGALLGTAHKRTKTLAEALVDAVQGVVATPKVHTCACGSTRWKTLSSLDGHTTKQCKQCRIRIPWCTTSIATRTLATRAGPFTNEAVALPSPPFTPTFKR